MKRFTSYSEIEALCEAMIKDFFRSRRYTGSLCVDIVGFVGEYLGLPIVYESFAEPDPGRIGFRSDGERPLRVRRENGDQQVVYPAGTIVIEKFLLDPGESARKRFTISHEGAHDVLGRHIPIQTRAAFHSGYDPDEVYTRETISGMLSVNECFANRAAACFLMPGFLTRRVLKRHNCAKKIIMYEGGVLAQDQKLLVQKMADTMGVSYTAFLNRLHELDMFETRPMEEYLRSGLCYGGGDRYAAC